ncbi:MAG: mechanosensitive ion channel, partial [Draconibacterium sp.]|nr:mechanosensitive ion channel [Draconibacterium sp.]
MKLTSILLIVFLSFFAYNSSNLIAQTTDSTVNNIIDSDTVQQAKSEQVNHVTLLGDSLFQINTYLGPYSANKRASIISNRLEELAQNENNIKIDSFTISKINNYNIISYKGISILSIGNVDANYAGKTKEQLAAEYLQIIKDSFETMIEKESLTDLLIDIGLTLFSLLGLFLIFFLLNKLFYWINIKLTQYEKGLKKKRKSVFKYLVPNKSSNIFLVASKIAKLAITVLILFLYLPFLFSFLPWTEGLAEKFYGYISDPVIKIISGLINFIPNLFSIFVIVIIARYFLKILAFVSKEIEDDSLKIKGFHRDWARPTFNLMKIIIYALAMVFTVQYLPASKAFQGVSIFVGVLFTLGSTGAIANMIAGIVITYMRPFVIGDRVKIGET